MNYTLYKITNLPTQKAYIGVSVNPSQRLSAHKGYNKHFFEGGYTFELLLTGLTRREAENAECRAVLEHRTLMPDGFNKRGGGFKGYKHELETINKMSANYNRNRKVRYMSSEDRKVAGERLREYRRNNPHPQLGKPMSDETKAKLSASKKGRPGHGLGKKLSEDHKQKMRDGWAKRKEAMAGKPLRAPRTLSATAIDNIRAAKRAQAEDGVAKAAAVKGHETRKRNGTSNSDAVRKGHETRRRKKEALTKAAALTET